MASLAWKAVLRKSATKNNGNADCVAWSDFVFMERAMTARPAVQPEKTVANSSMTRAPGTPLLTEAPMARLSRSTRRPWKKTRVISASRRATMTWDGRAGVVRSLSK